MREAVSNMRERVQRRKCTRRDNDGVDGRSKSLNATDGDMHQNKKSIPIQRAKQLGQSSCVLHWVHASCQIYLH